MKVSIFGLGYVGTVSLGCLARLGHYCIGVDLNKTKVDFINDGKSPIIEVQIDEIIKKQRMAGQIVATTDTTQAVIDTDISFICVGTPSTDKGHLNLDAIFRVSQDIAEGIKKKKGFHVVAIRSTVMPGTNEKLTTLLCERSGKRIDEDFCVVSNPEFLREGTAVNDYFNPPYTLLGTRNKKAIETMKELYKDINAPIYITDIRIAELIKYVNNTFHALKIVFANEIGKICNNLGIDSHKLIELVCSDTKLNISPAYMKSGFAYGGSCLPKDLKALATLAHDNYLECPVIENIERSNQIQKEVVLKKIMGFGKWRIGFLGLSFKAGTDDLRSSPIVDILETLLGKGYEVRIYDRNVRFAHLVGANREYILNKIPFISRFLLDDPEKIIENSEVVVVVNNEKEFSEILDRLPADRIVYDLVNINFKKRSSIKGYIGIAW